MEKDLIFGLAIGYDFEKIQVFLNSLNKTDFNGELLIVADYRMNIPKDFKTKFSVRILIEPRFNTNILTKALRKFSNAAVPKLSKNILGWVLKSITNENTFLNWFIRTQYVLTGRFAFYYKFLKNKKYRNILLTDIRDVYFQDNPFKDFDCTLAVFEESKMYQIKNESFNSFWVKLVFGESVLELIGDNIVCCAGTIMGSHKGIMDFLKSFLDACVKYKVPNKHGVDQAIFNFLIYTNVLNLGRKYLNGDRVLTIARHHIEDVKIVNNKFVYRDLQPLIVHQFDRHDYLMQFVKDQVL